MTFTCVNPIQPDQIDKGTNETKNLNNNTKIKVSFSHQKLC